METHRITITHDTTGKRIDAVTANLYPKYTRSQWAKWGQFTLNETPKPGKTKARVDQVWTVQYAPQTPMNSDITPWTEPLTVHYEDAHVAVVEKQLGISVHPSRTEPEGKTLLNQLVAHFGGDLAPKSEEIDGVEVPRMGLIHRLDKPTSGLIMIAKTADALAYYPGVWHEKVTKQYRAIVTGRPPLRGLIDLSLARHRTERTRMTIVPAGEGKHAKTTFNRMWVEKNQSELDLTLHTGRTHQLRVHLSATGFPIVGDGLYGGNNAPRLMLHAWRLTFPRMEDGKEIIIESEPEWS